MKKSTQVPRGPSGARRRSKAAQAGRQNAPRKPAKKKASTAIRRIRETVRRMRAKLARARGQIAVLEAAAETDYLLDIPNRRGFERELNRSVAYIKRYHARAAVILLDVDRLKAINDAFGHAAGL
jgi:PleD family two-component response regulator